MVDKLEAGKTYRCIDLNGYYSESVLNIDYWKEFSDGNSYTVEEVTTTGEGMMGGIIAIDNDELQYFELVEDTPTEGEIFWDGKQKLEVGMIVGWARGDDEFEVVFMQTNNNMKTFTVLKDCDGNIHIAYINLLTSLLPDPREEFSKKVLAEIRGMHQDYAQDTTWDIKDLAKLCYDKLKGGDNA